MKENKPTDAHDVLQGLKELNIQGDVYYTTFNRKFSNRQNWIKPDKKQVISFIPGTIRQVLIKPGDIVKAEDKILVLEAMKMMNTIHAPMSGKIKSVLVSVGDRMPKGTLMVEFE
jgi:biotin carboxyl carrier protein